MSAWIFWASLLLIAYTHAGYAILAALLARRRGTIPIQADLTPPLTVVITAYNEASRIAQRIDDVLAQDYPAQNLALLVVSDGSDDGTEHVAASGDARVRVLVLARNDGKAAALNAAMANVTTEFVVFSDARQRFAPGTLRHLMRAFADPGVGAVSGELQIVENDTRVGLYWRLETFLREREALLGWLHGVSGAVYALRTRLFRTVPTGLLLDDLWIPLHVAFSGSRVWMARDAVAWDVPSTSAAIEYRRKLRTLAGNWQLLARLPRLLNPRRNPVFFAWCSHKLLRLIAPWALIALWLTSASTPGAFYRFAFYAQTLAYVVAALALVVPRVAARLPLAAAAGSFVLLNAAALMALPASLAPDARRLWSKH
jgi:cellulose synthase/poly-beta-1,6-N-acetylglucosamine synthase-like glycosyltransferase